MVVDGRLQFLAGWWLEATVPLTLPLSVRLFTVAQVAFPRANDLREKERMTRTEAVGSFSTNLRSDPISSSTSYWSHRPTWHEAVGEGLYECEPQEDKSVGATFEPG